MLKSIIYIFNQIFNSLFPQQMRNCTKPPKTKKESPAIKKWISWRMQTQMKWVMRPSLHKCPSLPLCIAFSCSMLVFQWTHSKRMFLTLRHSQLRSSDWGRREGKGHNRCGDGKGDVMHLLGASTLSQTAQSNKAWINMHSLICGSRCLPCVAESSADSASACRWSFVGAEPPLVANHGNYPDMTSSSWAVKGSRLDLLLQPALSL